MGSMVIPWTSLEPSDDVFADVENRGVLTSGAELYWMAGDTEVDMVELPHYAGKPEDFIPHARPIASPAGSSAHVDTGEGWPPLIWRSETLHRAVRGLSDHDVSVEVILCALTVAPDDGDLRPMLLASLKARYAALMRHGDLYPQPWRTGKNWTRAC